jgi:hypothetical protein
MMLNVHTLVVAAVVWSSLVSTVLAFSAADYNSALGTSILFYDLQRSGSLPTWQRLRWRGNSALNDGRSQGVSKCMPIPQFSTHDVEDHWRGY